MLNLSAVVSYHMRLSYGVSQKPYTPYVCSSGSPMRSNQDAGQAITVVEFLRSPVVSGNIS